VGPGIARRRQLGSEVKTARSAWKAQSERSVARQACTWAGLGRGSSGVVMVIGTSTLGDREGAHGVARATIYQYRGAIGRKLTVHLRGEDGGVVGERRLCVRTSVRGGVVLSTLCHTGVRAGAPGAAVWWMRGHTMPTEGGARGDTCCRREGTPVADNQDASSRLSARPSLISLSKQAELRASPWCGAEATSTV